MSPLQKKTRDEDHAPVSVIIPHFRSGATLERAIISVCQQTWRPVEVIIVDDASGSDHDALFERLRGSFPDGWLVILRLAENVGPASARNRGWERASAKYIAFLDADDMWHPAKIELQCQWMLKNPTVMMSGHRRIRAGELTLSDEPTWETAESGVLLVKQSALLFRNPFATSSIMIQRDLAQRFPEGKRYGEDYMLWHELLAAKYLCVVSGANLATYFADPFTSGGLTSNLWAMFCGEVDAIVRQWVNARVGTPLFLLAMAWAGVRFMRRLILRAQAVLAGWA